MKKKSSLGLLLVFSFSCVSTAFAQSGDQATSKQQDSQHSASPIQRQLKKVKPALGRPRVTNVDVSWSERRAFEKQSGLSWQETPLKQKQKFIRQFRRQEEKQIRNEKRQVQRELRNKARLIRQIHRDHTKMRRAKAKEEKNKLQNFKQYKKQTGKNIARLQKQGSRGRRVRVKPIRIRQ